MVAPRKTKRPFEGFWDFFGVPKGSLQISGVKKMREQHRLHGGKFVIYLHSASFIWFKNLSTDLIWVEPEVSPRLRGIQTSWSSLFLGWWSFEGMINTLLTLSHNFLGGFDFTHRVLNPSTQDGWLNWEADDLNRAFQKRRFNLFIGLLVFFGLFVLPMLGILLFTLLDKWLR